MQDGNAFNENTAAIRVLVNGEDQTDRFEVIDRYTLSGLVDGLNLGSNTVAFEEARSMGRGKAPRIVNSGSIELVNYPVSGPIFSGEHQKAFVCTVQDHGLGQPIPDSETGWSVRNEANEIIGRSEACHVDPLVTYVYRTTGGGWSAYTPGDTPGDMATTATLDGQTVPYIVRWERGVINRFIEQYGVPMYTVSVGGSGGGIQQYVYGQNFKSRIIDAAIPQYSYPDMLTQTIHIGDCEPLEFYMDAVNPGAWSTWSNRSWLIGLNASDDLPNPFTGGTPGTDECVESWRGLSPLVLNPHYGYESGIETITPLEDVQAIQWTHWEDAVNIYGRDANGFAPSTWDNVGVQYGLQSLVDGHISPAPRTEGSIEAMNAAYEKGHVFVGDIDIPIIDWRHYLEHELDMHNSHQSFASRQRMLNFDGDASNQVIWFTDAREGDSDFDQTPEALAVMDQWMMNILQHPNRSVAQNKPALAVDRCFDSWGDEIAAGDDVWDGILNDEPAGACTQTFPIYSTSRIVAGAGIEGNVFKCALQSIDEALAKGVYGGWTPTLGENEMFQAIFPDGVCDYTQPDIGRPD